MTNAQTEAREIETQAWCCDEWPEWLHKIVDETCEVADRLDMSAEQAHAFAVLTALAAKGAELEEWRGKLAETIGKLKVETDRAERTEAQPAEANKALETIFAIVGNVEHKGGGANAARMYEDMLNDFRQIARRAREQGGE